MFICMRILLAVPFFSFSSTNACDSKSSVVHILNKLNVAFNLYVKQFTLLELVLRSYSVRPALSYRKLGTEAILLAYVLFYAGTRLSGRRAHQTADVSEVTTT